MLVWLFLGNLFWVSTELVSRIWGFITNTFPMTYSEKPLPYLRVFDVAITMLSVLCFLAGVSIIFRIHKLRRILFGK